MQQIYQHPWYSAQLKLGNITDLESQSQPKQKPENLGLTRTDLDPNRIGDIAEAYVRLIAQWKGAEVYNNASCVGKTDLILSVDNQLIEIDVKLAQWRKTSSHYCWSVASGWKVKPPVYLVMVIPEGDIMDWKIRWKNQTAARNSPPHCPPGLENFWSKSSTNV